MRGWKRPLAVLTALAAIALAIWGFLEGRAERAMEVEREQPVNAPLRVSRTGDTAVVTLDAARQRASGIEVVAVHSANRAGQERAYGTVLDLQSLTDLSNSHSTARAQLQTAQAKLRASRAAFERAESLYKGQKIMSEAEFQAQESAFRIDEAAVAAATSQLHTIAATTLQTWGPVLARAIEDGSPLLANLIGQRDVLIQVTLPVNSRIAEPPATASLESNAGSTTRIGLVSRATKTDPSLQGSSFYYLAPAGATLLPDTKVVVLLTSPTMVRGTAVPASAVVWWQGHAWVYLRVGSQDFVRRQIEAELSEADGSYIVDGLPDEAELVIQGAQLLLSEELRTQVQVGEEGV